ncbi:hypothetical protein WJX73_005721 [Symbiochloris irregularis]|uniref:Cyclin N-terminal domain-containing protein n=1 Tax=Symbiochloris irregularis TaxID=706552 RepID=A0AAW1PEA4_9CHLO
MAYRQLVGGPTDVAYAADAAAASAAGRKNRTKQGPPNKRYQEEDPEAGEILAVGAKKNRHAFGDVTNQENASGSQLRASQQGKGDRLDSFGTTQGLQERGQVGFAIPGPPGSSPVQPFIKDIDVHDEHEPITCATYAQDIYAHLFASEKLRRPSTTYMESYQNDLTAQMRSILVDWMIEVAQEYELVSDTLFLAISYIDRFLTVKQIERTRLQLVGVACLLIAAKYEEIYAPQVDELCFITENTYTRQEIIAMETDVLDGLKFECTTPTVKVFLRRFCVAAGDTVSQQRLHFLTSYLAELALPEYSALQYLPSQVAAAAVLVAGFSIDTNFAWTPALQHYTRCSASELSAPARMLHTLFLNARTSPLPAAREKFSNITYGNVAAHLPPQVLPQRLFLDNLVPDRSPSRGQWWE